MKVLVVGGGISGLVAAYELGRAGIPVTLVEANPRLGGKVGTEHVDGYVVERGPDSFLVGKPAAVGLCRDLGLAGALVPPRSPSDVFVWHGRLVPVPEGLGSGIPRAFRPVALSPLFSLREKLGLARELFVPPGTGSGDEAVGAFLRRRFGDALVDRLASPLLEGRQSPLRGLRVGLAGGAFFGIGRRRGAVRQRAPMVGQAIVRDLE